jgi:hypothetical protein
MAGGKHARVVTRGLTEAERKLNGFEQEITKGAVIQGLYEFGNDLQRAAYASMKLPSTGKRSPSYVGLRWRRTSQIHSKPEPTGRPGEFQIRVQPQYLALWQEHGVRPHTVFNPDKQRADTFRRTKARKVRAQARLTKLGNIQNRSAKEQRRFDYAKKSIDKRESELRNLAASAGNSGVAGYSEPSKIPKKNQRSDWFKGNTPKAADGRRAGQSRPVVVPSGQKIQTRKFIAPIRPIERGALRIASRHRDRMARLLADAYRRKGR